MHDNHPENYFVTPAARDLAVPFVRDAARGIVPADAAYRELRRHIRAATGDGSDPARFLPSRGWFDREIQRATARSRAGTAQTEL
jgi:hypothetical protein